MKPAFRFQLPLLCSLALLVSCNDEQRALRDALQAAGPNRSRLEAVLEHYGRQESDSLKLRAAQYLIRYMPLHRSYDARIEALYDRVDSLIPLYPHPDSLGEALGRLSASCADCLEVQLDCRVVSADFLIRNIEQAFALWRRPWARHLDFDDFCEYLLPYKCCDRQPLTDWRGDLAGVFNGGLGRRACEQLRDNPWNAARDVNDTLTAARGPFVVRNNPFPIFRATTVSRLKRGSCEEACIAAAQVMRSKGIPVSLDFTPNWPDRPQNHTWLTVLNRHYRNEPISVYSTDRDAYFRNRPLAKVFRMTYRTNPEAVGILARDGWMPPSLSCLFSRDVTASYTRADTIDCPLYDLSGAVGTVYLAVFDNRDWVPVCWGKRHGRGVRFEGVGRSVLYMPVVYDERHLQQPAGDPFYLDCDGSVQYLHADTTRRRTVRLTRKYPIYELVDNARASLRGGVLVAADNPHFRGARTVLRLPTDTLVLAGTERLDSLGTFRYWQVRSSDAEWCDLAELQFYAGDERLRARVFPEQDHAGKYRFQRIDDGDVLTYSPLREPDYRIGFDFGRPVRVTKVVWVRRGDGNDVYPDHEYTLYAWLDRRWTAVGHRRVGLETCVEFSGVPDGALLLLVCNGGGTQSRPFCYRRGTLSWR